MKDKVYGLDIIQGMVGMMPCGARERTPVNKKSFLSFFEKLYKNHSKKKRVRRRWHLEIQSIKMSYPKNLNSLSKKSKMHP